MLVCCSYSYMYGTVISITICIKVWQILFCCFLKPFMTHSLQSRLNNRQHKPTNFICYARWLKVLLFSQVSLNPLWKVHKSNQVGCPFEFINCLYEQNRFNFLSAASRKERIISGYWKWITQGQASFVQCIDFEMLNGKRDLKPKLHKTHQWHLGRKR